MRLPCGGKGNNCIKCNKDSLAWLEVASGICFAALALCVGKANTLDMRATAKTLWNGGQGLLLPCGARRWEKSPNVPPTVTK